MRLGLVGITNSHRLNGSGNALNFTRRNNADASTKSPGCDEYCKPGTENKNLDSVTISKGEYSTLKGNSKALEALKAAILTAIPASDKKEKIKTEKASVEINDSTETIECNKKDVEVDGNEASS